ncbi:hypothetical protein OIE66_40040 [Nonomuraea sp. NBC_01738]|uniref:hypothetical protein n=1 Tax=Nonomuraea sp. NBC_01738 TaxID=2976003 RepID=UPI002E14EAE7|nr:hypothetical protein OIE66_40040 [Nonomuraea sp. NBC_01738]
MRLLVRSALAGSAVALSLLLLMHWPTNDSDDELNLLKALIVAPFPLSALAARLARLSPSWLIGLLAPVAMLLVFMVQPDDGSWLPDEQLGLYVQLAVPIVVGFMLTAVTCFLITERTTGLPPRKWTRVGVVMQPRTG